MHRKTRSSSPPPNICGVCVDDSGRRSSTYTAGRPSSIGFLSQAGTQFQKDTRPIKSEAFKAACQRNILDYLISANYPLPISLKTLQSPTSKDFATIFKFLYNRMDPNYQFVKKIEDEVILCLKALKYVFYWMMLMLDIRLLIPCQSRISQLFQHSMHGLGCWLH